MSPAREAAGNEFNLNPNRVRGKFRATDRTGPCASRGLADLKGLGFEGDVQGEDFDGFSLAVAVDGAGEPGVIADRVIGEAQALVGILGVDKDGKAGAHVKGGVGLAGGDGAVVHDELKDRLRRADGGDSVDEGLVEAHELAPAVAGDVGGVVQVNAGALARGDEADVDDRGVEEGLAVGAAVGEGGEVAVGQAVGEGAAEGEAVGVNAGGGEEEDGVAVAHVAGDAVGFGGDAADGGAGEDDRVGVDDAFESGGFAAAPDGVGLAAAFGEAFGEVVGAAGEGGEPGGVADGGVHRDGEGQGAGRYKIVDDGGDGVDADVAVEALAGEAEHGVGDEVLGAEPFFDVGEVFGRGFEEVGAFAADVGGFGEGVGGEGGRGGGGGALAGAFEGVEVVVVDAGGFVAEGGG